MIKPKSALKFVKRIRRCPFRLAGALVSLETEVENVYIWTPFAEQIGVESVVIEV